MENIILTLLCLSKVGRKTVLYLLENMTKMPINEKELLDIFIETKNNHKRLALPTLEEIKVATQKSKLIISNSKKQNIQMIDILDEKFPKRLMSIDNPPVVIFYKGNYDCLIQKNCVAIVGSRDASYEGLNASYKLGYNFGIENYCVVSGLATGCDEQAHKGCLESKGKTVAVLPCGLDSIYPTSNIQLANEIIDNNGCLVSEYPINTVSFKNNFIERDRIQSALSSAIIVCESKINSGTMHTVNYAKEQNKILGCIDINIDGNKKIIEDNNCIIIKNEKDLDKVKQEIKIFNENNIFNKKINENKQLRIKL